MAGDEDFALLAKALEDYQTDDRMPCKYGANCYQKNIPHLNSFKHPPKSKIVGKKDEKPSNSKENESLAASPKRKRKHESSSEDSLTSESSSDCRASKKKPLQPDKHEQLGSESSSEESPEPPVNLEEELYASEPEMPPSPSDVKENIKQKYLVEMPDDFYSFWELCKSLSKDHPALAFDDVGLQLVGPYEVLSGVLKASGKRRRLPLYVLRWRYYYDPPEFQTVLRGDDKRQFHMGYFRDDCLSLPVFVASNCAAKDGVFTQVAENIFGAVNVFLNDAKKSANPFVQPKIHKLQKHLQEWAKQHGFTLDTKTLAMKKRDRMIVSKTFHGLGLVVPVERNTEVGYRELIENDGNLRRILRQIVNSNCTEKEAAFDKLQPIITAANIANDECDFGTSVELGLDLFSFGGEELERAALQLLLTGYTLLGREEFAKIAQVHLGLRRKVLSSDMFPQ